VAEAAAAAEAAEAAAQATTALEATPPADGGTPALPPPEAMVDLGKNVQGSVRHASIVRVQKIIDEHLEDSVGFLRGWMHEKREAR
jgi:hypothetical protein